MAHVLPTGRSAPGPARLRVRPLARHPWPLLHPVVCGHGQWPGAPVFGQLDPWPPPVRLRQGTTASAQSLRCRLAVAATPWQAQRWLDGLAPTIAAEVLRRSDSLSWSGLEEMPDHRPVLHRTDVFPCRFSDRMAGSIKMERALDFFCLFVHQSPQGEVPPLVLKTERSCSCRQPETHATL